MDCCITPRSTSEPVGSITTVKNHPDRYCKVGCCFALTQWDRDTRPRC